MVYGALPPIMWNPISSVPEVTASVLGLIPSDEVAGVTVIVAVLFAPNESTTVRVAADEAATTCGSTVKVVAVGPIDAIATAVFDENTEYTGVPPVIVNITLSVAPANPVTEMLAGFIVIPVAAPPDIMVNVALFVAPRESKTFRVMLPATAVEGTVTVNDPAAARFQIPESAASMQSGSDELHALEGSVEVIT